MATIVETPDVSVLIDPSVRLGPFRYDLRPHPTEKARQKELWQAIRAASKDADVLTVSHYHYDHHNPDVPSIFRGKIAFLKDGKFHINRSQRQRAGAFVRAIKKYPKEMQAADGNQMDFGGTELLFSPALPHGYDDQLGYVVMTRIAHGDEVFVHTADVLGPPLKEHLSFPVPLAADPADDERANPDPGPSHPPGSRLAGPDGAGLPGREGARRRRPHRGGVRGPADQPARGEPRRALRVRATALAEGRDRVHVDRMGGDVPPDRTVDVVSVPDVPRGREGGDGRCRRRDPLDGGW